MIKRWTNNYKFRHGKTNKYIARLKDIEIPEEFKKTPPREVKMQRKWEYYRENNKLESSIIVDCNGVLVDGYTSYLIALADGIKYVEVIVE